MDQRKRNGLAVWGSSKVGSRIREKIRGAHGQLRAGKDQKLPSNDNELDVGSAREDEAKATPSTSSSNTARRPVEVDLWHRSKADP